MSNIIIINGSPRKQGATSIILHQLEKELLAHYHEVSFIEISELAFKPCAGCCSCYKNGHCFMDDDAKKLSQQIEAADGIIIGSPTYSSNISGQLKTFIDRGHFVIQQLLRGKYAISVITGENYGGNDAAKILNKLFQYSGAALSGKIICTLPFNSNPLSNQKLVKKIHRVSANFNDAIKHQKKYLSQRLFHDIIFNIGIKPFVHKKGDVYNGVLKRWENQK